MADNGTQTTTTDDKRKCHLAKPAEFSGKDFKSWWRSVQLYVLANKRDFTDDESKILFALSYMKGGNAERWAANFEDTVLDEKSGNFGTWAEFTAEMKGSFENTNARQDAQNKLEALKQGTQTAEEYFQHFELYRREAGFVGDAHFNYLQSLLEKQVNDVISDVIYNGDSLPTTYEAWKSKIIRIDGMQRRRKINKSTAPWQWQTSTPRPLPTPPRQNTPAQSPMQPTSTWKPSGTTFGGMGKPMDLDEARAKNVCYKCQQPGHIGRFCPNRKAPQQVRQQEWQQPQQQGTSYDVRNLSFDEMKKLHDTWVEAESGRQKQIEAKKAYMAKGF